MADCDTIPAATVIVLREHQSELQALLLQRSKGSSVASEFWVFPGGKVDSTDSPDGDRYSHDAALIAAQRECKEEAGLSLDTRRFIPYSHWTTPSAYGVRFSTSFFLTTCSAQLPVSVDGREITDHRWLTPAEILSLQASGEIKLLPPTFVSMLELSRCENLDAARHFAASRTPVRFKPVLLKTQTGHCSLYEGDSGYDSGSMTDTEPTHRLIMEPGNWRYLNTLCQPN